MKPSDLYFEAEMRAARPDSRIPTVTMIIASDASIPIGWSRISGMVSLDGEALCAHILANGQYMFSCSANPGLYDLNVPLDADGQITLHAFVGGLPASYTF